MMASGYRARGEAPHLRSSSLVGWPSRSRRNSLPGWTDSVSADTGPSTMSQVRFPQPKWRMRSHLRKTFCPP
jgi:hypothetical protein